MNCVIDSREEQMDIDISFIIPVYNTELGKLEKCIQCIQEIKEKKTECVIIDDGSEDVYAVQYRKLCSAKERILYYRQENAGVSSARNKGIQLAKGEYIYFCDSDDQIVSAFFNRSVKQKDIDIFFTKMYLISQKKETETCCISNTSGDITDKQLLNAILSCGFLNGPYCKLIRRDFVIKNQIRFNIEMKNGEDLVFLLQMLQNFPKMFFYNESSYKYFYEIENRENRVFKDPKRCLDDNDKVANELMKTAKILGNIDLEELELKLTKGKINTIFFDAANIAASKKCKLTPQIKNMYHTEIQRIDKKMVTSLDFDIVVKYHVIRDKLWVILVLISYVRKAYLRLKNR